MNRKHLAIILTVTIALIGVAAATLVPSALATASKAPAAMDESGPLSRSASSGPGTTPGGVDRTDFGPGLRARTPKYVAEIGRISAGIDVPLVRAAAAYTAGDTLTWLALDEVDPMGKNFLWDIFETDYEVKVIKEYCEVWVQTDLNYYNADGTVNYLHPDAKDALYVTDERINYLAEQCNDIIRPTDVAFFGPYDSRDGTAGYEADLNYYYGTHVSEVDGKGDRIVILVSNIRDQNFYDPINNPKFFWGFYWGTFSYYGDRNFITIDSKAWNRYAGNTGNPADSYQFDATITHELQHLIQADLSPNEETWINEGLAGFAEFLLGYWQNDDLGWRTQWQTWPENSLIMWDDQYGDQGETEIYADYQLVNAFMLYTTGRIGGSYTDTAKLTRETEDGILGFNEWLSDTAATNPQAVGLTLESLFEDFRVDMLHGGTTNDAQPGARWNAGFIGSYESPLERNGGPATSAAYLGLLRDNLDREAYDWPGVPPFGTDFLEVCWSDDLSTGSWEVALDGDETAPPTEWSAKAAIDIYSPSTPASGDVLYSGHTDQMDNFVVFGPVMVGASDELSFDHYYNIEEGWDFGFVQVTTDMTGKSGWSSLNVAGTVSSNPDAHPIIKANVPGFSGFSGGWISATYDLGAEYAGEQILLTFRYSADTYTAGQEEGYPSGWAIDNVKIGSTTLTAGEVGTGRSIEEVRGAGPKFSLEFLTWTDGHGVDVNNVYSVTLSAAQTGTLDLAAIAASDAGFDEPGERGVLMVSSGLEYHTDLIHGGIRPAYADYSLTGLPPSICTSEVDLYGDSHTGKDGTYAGGVITAAVHVDNLGSSPDITTTASVAVHVGVEIPASTTYKAATGGAAYTTDLSTVSASFPAEPGVFWSGPVARVDDFEAVFTTDATLVANDRITAIVHFADGATTPDQTFVDEDSVEVYSAFGLSGYQVVDPAYPNGSVQSSASVLNLSGSSMPVQLIADIPTDTTFVGVTGATDVVTSTTQVTVTQVVMPYADAGATTIAFEWQLGPSYKVGDVVTSAAKLVDLQTGEVFALADTASIRGRLYLPIMMRNN